MRRSTRRVMLISLPFCLVGCGGGPPAVRTAPQPPFVPQAVTVPLGTSGRTIELITSASGGYTLDGEVFASGTEVAVANGSVYTLTLDSTTWSAAYKMPEPISLALGISGENISIQRLEDGSYQYATQSGDGGALADGTDVTAGNGNTYTVTVGADGMFTAAYVPAVVRIPLGVSGDALDVVHSEDGSYSIMIGGEAVLITADTRVTSTNGNVYAVMLPPPLPPGGRMPVRVMHLAAMQDVTLGELGGKLQLTQDEDRSWLLGEMKISDGHVHAHANGGSYVLTLDEAGMWRGTYRPEEATLQLGDQQATLVRSEDRSWRWGSQTVMDGSKVISDIGNTYTLSYAGGAWTARFEPELVKIEGTNLTAMVKEDGSGYDVAGVSLPNSGTADIDTQLGIYRITLVDGERLAGTRLDLVPIRPPYYTRGLGAAPAIIDDYSGTLANEKQTALVIPVPAEDGSVPLLEQHSFTDLLDSGMSRVTGPNYVAAAYSDLVKIQTSLESILGAVAADTRDALVEYFWGTDETPSATNVKGSLEKVFGEIPGFADAVPESSEAQQELDEIITALSSPSGLAAALQDGGVLHALGISSQSKSAQEIFDAMAWETSISYRATDGARLGVMSRKRRSNALAEAQMGELGAFVFGLPSPTDYARDVSLTGSVNYEGETLAVDQDSTYYSGDIAILIHFGKRQVRGLVTNLRNASGEPWKYTIASYSSETPEGILLEETLKSDASWRWRNDDETMTSPPDKPFSPQATISFPAKVGGIVSRQIPTRFQGRLFGNKRESGDYAIGTWAIGDNKESPIYLAGSFSAGRVSRKNSRDRPAAGDGTMVRTSLSKRTETQGNSSRPLTKVSNNQLNLEVERFFWERIDKDDLDKGHTRSSKSETRTIDLKTLLKMKDKGSTHFGRVFRNEIVKILHERGRQLSLLHEAELFPEVQVNIWQRIQEIMLTYMFDPLLGRVGRVNRGQIAFTWGNTFQTRLPPRIASPPAKIAGIPALAYDSDQALERIDELIWTLSSVDNLQAALSEYGADMFVPTDAPPFWLETLSNDYVKEIYSRQESQLRAWAYKTDYTGFGVWYLTLWPTASAREPVIKEPDLFAYSSLRASQLRFTDVAFPQGGRASYSGATVGLVSDPATPYRGNFDMYVDWNDKPPAGGTLTAVLRDLVTIGAAGGEELRYYDGTPVLDIVFEPLAFSGRVMMFSSSKHGVNIRLNTYVTERANTATLEGRFTGSSSNGPLAVIGWYTIPGFGSKGITSKSMGNPSGDMNGSFGADLLE